MAKNSLSLLPFPQILNTFSISFENEQIHKMLNSKQKQMKKNYEEKNTNENRKTGIHYV